MSNKAGKMKPGTINTKVKELLKNGPISRATESPTRAPKLTPKQEGFCLSS